MKQLKLTRCYLALAIAGALHGNIASAASTTSATADNIDEGGLEHIEVTARLEHPDALGEHLGEHLEVLEVRTGHSVALELLLVRAVERVRLEQKDYQFLFANGDMLSFMDLESYEQIELPTDFLGDRAAFLQDGMQIIVESHEGKPIGVQLPDQVTLEITETEPVVKGQTAANSFKPATCTGGVRVMVPPFVGTGEKIVVQTADSTYLRRAD